MTKELVKNRLLPLEYDAGSVVYEHVRRLVEAITRRAVRMGYDRMEAESAANMGFAVALETFDPAKERDFVFWVKQRVVWEISAIGKRKPYRRLPLVSKQGPDDFDLEDFEDPSVKTEPFDPTSLLRGLSDDAKVWVSLVVDPPDAILGTAHAFGWTEGSYSRGQEAAKFRQAVFEFLRDSGWSKTRATRAYLEVEKAFNAKGRE